MWSVETTTTVSVAASPVVVHEVTPSADGHRVLHYSAYSGANVRGGVVHMLWQRGESRAECSHVSTDSVGSTSALTFDVGFSGATVRLTASSSSGTWTVNTMVVSYERAN